MATFLIRYIIATSIILNFADAKPKESGKRTVNIPLSHSGWMATGVILDGKRSVKVKATGSGNYCSGGPLCNATPDGSLSGESHCQSGTNAPFALCGALIGRIGAGTPFVLGTGVSLPRSAKGALEIGIQDFLFEDNTGNFSVTIKNYKKDKYLLSGNVLTSNGKPFPNERLRIIGKNKTYLVRTDSNGFYSAELKEGKYKITPERQQAFPSSFNPLTSVDVNLAFNPRNRLVDLLQDTTGQNFLSVKFSAVKAQMYKIKARPIFEGLQFQCLLKEQSDRDIAQISGINPNTKILFSDTEREEIKLKVIGDGPYGGVKRDTEKFAAFCEGKLLQNGGIGVPTFLLETGGSTAFIELAPNK